MLTLKFVRQFCVIGFVAACTTACAASYDYKADLAPATMASKKYSKNMDALQAKLQQSPLRYKLIYVADRLAPAFADQPNAQNNIVMHTYPPQAFPGGAGGYAQSVLEDALEIQRPTTTPENVRFIGVDLKEVDARILHGNFVAGQLGRYYAKVVAEVRVTDHNGEVLVSNEFIAEQQNIRQGYTGRHLSVEQDETNMRLTLDTALQTVAVQVVESLL